jgi:O-antigen/teichoic acid export membrane protein
MNTRTPPAAAWWARLRQSTLVRRTAHAAGWSLAGSLAQRGGAFLGWVLLARLLDQRAFGELGLLATTLNLCATLAGLGLGTATTKFMAEWRVRDPARAGRVLGLTLRWAATGGLITLALVALAAPALARWGLAAAHLTDAVRLTALMIPLATLNGVQISALYGLEAFRTLAWTNLATAALAVAGPPVGAWLGGLPGAVLGQLAAQVVYVTASQVALRREVRRAGLRVVYDAPPGERADLLRFSGPTLLATLLVLPPTWLSQSLVAHGPDGHHELALLTAASQLQMVMLFLSGTLGAQILPLLANVDAGRDPRTYQRALLLQYGLNGVVTAGAGLAIWLAAPLLLGLYGDAFARGRNLLALLLASALCMAVAGVAGKALLSLGRVWTACLLNLLWAAVLVPVTATLVGRQGALGYATAHLLAYGTLMVASVWILDRVLRLAPGRREATA